MLKMGDLRFDALRDTTLARFQMAWNGMLRGTE
jgi:hypothetical protein